MKLLPFCKSALLALISICTAIAQSPDPAPLILKNATLINVKDGTTKQTSLLIHRQKIHSLRDFESLGDYDKATILDCQGKYIIPGLFDMHTHFLEHDNATHLLPDLVRKGITSIRDMGGYPDSIAAVKATIEAGKLIGPQIYFAGFTLDGVKERDGPDLSTKIITDSTDLSQLLTSFAPWRIDFIKVHTYFPGKRLKELIHVAAAQHLSVVGHIPIHVDPIEAVHLGLKSIEHANSLLSGLVFKEGNGIKTITQAFAALDETYLDSLSHIMMQHNAAFTPTLYIIQKTYQAEEDEYRRNLGEKMMQRFKSMMLRMLNNGVLMLAGSDDPPITQNTLDALHQELYWLVQAGFSPLEALQSATLNPAKFLGVEESYGRIKPGFMADLVILNQNPLEDIRHTQHIFRVIQGGQVID